MGKFKKYHNVFLVLLTSSVSLLLLFVYFQDFSSPRWMRRFPLYKSRSSREENEVKVFTNIWGVKEESFLNTPFFSGKCESEMSFKFQDVQSPQMAASELIDVQELPNIHIEDYYTQIHNQYCLVSKIDIEKSKSAGACVCEIVEDPQRPSDGGSQPFKSQFNGARCDIPGSVWKVRGRSEAGLQNLTLSLDPRRVVMGLVVDHELEMTEIRIRQLHHIVDIFVILESSITAGGDPKPLYFFNAFQKGYLCEFQHKILYVYLDKFPKGYVEDGWLADGHLRNEMSQAALERVQNLQDRDLFLSFDADEIPKAEVVLFLRFHDEIPNPIHFNLRWTLFSFPWQHSDSHEGMTRIVAGCTIDFLKEVVDGNVISVRKKYFYNDIIKWTSYKGPKSALPYEIGVDGDYSGHHCSWCTSPEGVSIKLRSAIHQDFPRWGDFPEKLKLDFLADVIYNGRWFDGGQPASLVTQESYPDFAPEFMLFHPEKYHHLLVRDQSPTISTTSRPIITTSSQPSLTAATKTNTKTTTTNEMEQAVKTIGTLII